MKYSSTYTPQQNQTAERANRTVLSCARTMLIAADLPKKYWGYAVLYACDVLLCTPRSRLNNKTPYELLFGNAPDISHFRTFGCKAWGWVPKALRKKWDPRAKQGIFVGFARDTPAYLVYIPEERSVLETPFCLFDESKFGGEKPVVLESYFGEANARGGDDKEATIPDGWEAPIPPLPEVKVKQQSTPPSKRRRVAIADEGAEQIDSDIESDNYDPTEMGARGATRGDTHPGGGNSAKGCRP